MKPDSVDDGLALTSEADRGMGTSELENGVAPLEYGTFGLLVELMVVFVPKVVKNEPAK